MIDGPQWFVNLEECTVICIRVNCKFEVDNVEDEWQWQLFNFVFARCTAGSFTNPQEIIRKSYQYGHHR